MLGAWIRRTGFWLVDALRGGMGKRIYQDIVGKESSNYADTDDLKRILNYAIDHVPFYKTIPRAELSEFPVMNKAIYKAQKERCMSEEYSDYSTLHRVSTSGSTGEPMIVYQNREKRERVKIDLIHAHERIGWGLGQRYIFIRNWVSNYQSGRLKRFAQNMVPVGIAQFDVAAKQRLFRYLVAHPQTVLFGYSSSICDFMNWARRSGLDGNVCRLRVIVCDSDALEQKDKRLLNEFFSCPVIDRYDNEENGLIAITSIGSDQYAVNYTALHIELLRLDKDETVAPGEIGRVVITDLHNRAMPLIRYETGDLAVSLDEPGRIRTLERLCGRQAVHLTTPNGVQLSAVAISGVMEVFYGVERYQVVQHSASNFELKYVGELTVEEEKILRGRLTDAFGSEAVIRITRVDSIPLEKNGKLKTMVNLCQR